MAGCDGLFNDGHWQGIARRLGLSNRQEEICRCLTCGMSDQQIAGDLDIAVGTVRTHLSRLYAKLDTQDRVETVVRVFDAFMAECRKNGCPRLQ